MIRIKVTKELANAIEFLRKKGFSDFRIVSQSEQIHMLFRDFDKPIFDALRVIQKHDGIVMQALVVGYEVEHEHTPEEKMKGDIEYCRAKQKECSVYDTTWYYYQGRINGLIYAAGYFGREIEGVNT